MKNSCPLLCLMILQKKRTFYYTSHNGMESSFLEVLQMRIIILFSILWTLKGSYFLITYLTLIWNPFLWRISDKNWSIVFCWKKRSKNYEICALVFSSLWPWYGFSIPTGSFHRFGMFLETHTAPTSLVFGYILVK